MATRIDPNPHLGDDAQARQMANALDALAAAEMAGAPAGFCERLARASMPTRGSGLRFAGAPNRPWAARMRPVFAMAAAVAIVAGAAIFFITRPATAPEIRPIAEGSTPTTTPFNSVPPDSRGKTLARTPSPQLAIAKASSDIETWLAVANEMDALMTSSTADLSASTSALEERAYAAFAADDWFSESSL